MANPFDAFRSKLGIGSPTQKGVGFNYTPTILQQGQTRDQVGQDFLDKLSGRKETGQSFYTNMKQAGTNRLANTLVKQSAGLDFDEFGKPKLNLGDFGSAGQTRLKGITQHGDLATQIAQNQAAYRNAVMNQSVSGYGMTGNISVDPYSGSAIPGATSGNVGARAAAAAMKVAANHTAYVWGGNSLTNGVDCSGLVQQIYRQLGISVPRTTYEQAKFGKQVPVNQIRPGDLVFYNNYGHVGIYVGNGKIVHAANPKLGVITSNLTNSNGAPLIVLRPY